MPLARINTARSNSRSPAPPSNSRALSTPRTFLPPSHYAAAAGITYSPRSPTYSEDDHSYEVNYSKGSRNDSVDSREPHGSSFMPVTYASETESTDSSFDYKPTSGVRFSSPDGEKQSLPAKPSIRGKRQSVITGLPQLETHLLPSLRDTIDRMTRSPSKRASNSSPGDGSRLEIPSSSNSAWSSRPLSPSGASPSPQFEDSALTSERTTSRVYHSESQENSPYDIPSGSATPVEYLTPKTNLPTKSTLKSALRAPTPKIFSRTPPSTEDTPLSIGGVTFKSVRSILKRKASTSSVVAAFTPGSGSNQKTTPKTSKPPVLPAATSTRARSRTDPGTSTVSARRLSSEDRKAAIDQSTDRTTEKETRETNATSFTSSIPRLQGRTQKSMWSQSSHTDESDLEYRYEMEARDRRKLVVTNAEVGPSSSESEAERRGGVRGQRVEKDHRSASKSSREGPPLIGLGFDLDHGNTRKESANAGNRREATNTRHQDSSRSTSHTWAPDSRAPSSSSARPAGFRSPRDKKLARDLAPTSRPTDDLEAEHRRRRAALLGIVSRLELGAPSTYISGETEESEYCGEDGLAISGSGDFETEAPEQYPAPWQADKTEGEYTERVQEVQQSVRFRAERPRSSSCMPTFVFSNDDDDEFSSYPAYRYQRRAEPLRVPSPNVDMSRKSHSRSPVIRQKDTQPVPPALKRHPVCRPPSPQMSSSFLDERNLSTRRTSPSENRESFQRRRASSNVESSGSYPAAARERQAYGIPSSDSVEVYRRTNRLDDTLPHAESDLSSVSSVYWDEGCDSSELSVGAETLFRKLSGGPAKEAEWRNHQGIEKIPRSNLASGASSLPLGYEGQVVDRRRQQRTTSPSRQGNRPRPPRPPSKSPDLQDTQSGDLENKRQELIIEICQTEEVFVRRLQSFVRLFILPLRVQDGKTWISGVPSEIARLFDWLEDIVVLHRQLLSSLKVARSAQYPLVERIAESMRTFIPRLEIYQPYLVKLVDVTGLINQLVQDESSDFGEFVEMQEGAPECEGWNIEQFLVEPVNRLAKFPEFFSRLLELTPKNHSDYLSTFSLLHCTDMVIRVMTEVKAREDEYDLIKKFSACLQGLPSSVQLATRERRLLQQGTLLLVDVDDKKANPNTPESFDIARYFPPGAKRDDTRAAKRTSRLANTIDDAKRKRSEGASPSNAGMSYRSNGSSSSSASSNAPSAPSTTAFSSFRIPMHDRPDKARRPSSRLTSPRSNPPSTARPSFHGTPIQVFIFSDLVLFTIPASSSTRTTEELESERWTLLKHIGIVRILGVQDLEPPDKNTYDSNTIAVDVLPVDINKLDHVTPVDDDGSVIVLNLAVPRQDTPPQSLPRSERPASPADDHLETRLSWISAFQRCFRFTLCSISGPSSGRNQDPQQLDLKKDTHKTIFSLLASGLPLPKSPSGQVAALHEGERIDATNLEREERGWWTLRFQQVSRELQRQDIALSLN